MDTYLGLLWFVLSCMAIVGAVIWESTRALENQLDQLDDDWWDEYVEESYEESIKQPTSFYDWDEIDD